MPTDHSEGSIILLGHRNLFEGGERNLILERARALWRYADISTRVLAFGGSRASRPMLTEREQGLEIEARRLEGILDIPRKRRWLMREFRDSTCGGRVRGVILSGLFATPLASALRFQLDGKPLFLDVHGAIEELREYPRSLGSGRVGETASRAAGGLLFHWARWHLRRALDVADAALVVSRPMARYLEEQFQARRSIVIPCGLSLPALDFSELLSARVRQRKEWGVSDNEPVFCFAGGLSGWQCCLEGLRAAAAVIREIGSGAVAIATADSDGARELAQQAGIGDRLVSAEWVRDDRLIQWLAGGDVGLLLRRSDMTNRVAFPNKFAQYLAAGMLVLSSPGLAAVAEIIEQRHLGVLAAPDEEEGVVVPAICSALSERARNMRRYIARAHDACREETDMSMHVRPLADALSSTSLARGRR